MWGVGVWSFIAEKSGQILSGSSDQKNYCPKPEPSVLGPDSSFKRSNPVPLSSSLFHPPPNYSELCMLFTAIENDDRDE